MTEREQVEQLTEQGSWLENFLVCRLRQSDGCVFDFVSITGTHKRVWLYFSKNERWSSAEFEEHVAQKRIADWRFRRAQ